MSNKKGNNKRSRQFSYTTPIKYEGQYYPSAEANLMDDNDMVRQGRAFVDGNGQYYTLGPTGEANPVMQSTDLNGVTVTAKYTPKKWFNDYLTMSNDNTQVLNQPNNGYNQHLEERGINGAKANAAWEQDHPNLTAWGYMPSALAFATAAAPAAMAAGDAIAGTAAGEGLTNTLGLMANAASNSTWLPWVDAGLSSAFAANGLQDVQNGRFTPQTAMDLMPLAQLGKPMYEAGKGLYYVAKDWRPFVPWNPNRYYRIVGKAGEPIKDAVESGFVRGPGAVPGYRETIKAQLEQTNPNSITLLPKAMDYPMFSKGKPWEGSTLDRILENLQSFAVRQILDLLFGKNPTRILDTRARLAYLGRATMES